MRNLSRYLRVLCQYSKTNRTKALVGFLMVGMTVNPASADHWLHGMDCLSPCQPPVIEICPPVSCCPPMDCCHEHAVDDFGSPSPAPAPSDSPEQELIPPMAVAVPEQDADQPESSIVNRPTLEADDMETPAVSEAIVEPEPELDSQFDAPRTPDPMPEESFSDDAPADDIFDEPAAAEDSPAEMDPLDEPLPSTEEEMEVPENLAPEDSDEIEDPSFDDLFGQPVLSEPGGLASRAVRQWTDDGARFRCEARLQQVTAKTVVLVKSNGKRIAVYFSRLSDDDLQFVRQQVVAQRELLAQRAAAELLASLGTR